MKIQPLLSGAVARDVADLLSDPERTPAQAFDAWFGVRYGEPDEEGASYPAGYDAHAAEAETAKAIPETPFFSLVLDKLNAPRLEPGEHAHIDPSDREPIDGKLFMVGWNDGRRSIVQLRALPGGAWEFGFMNDATRHGPYSEDELAERMVGRVAATITHMMVDTGGDRPLVA